MTPTEAATVLSSSPDHRVLHRVPDPAEWQLQAATGQVLRGVVVDTETTGTEATDEVVELAIVPFGYDRVTGLIVEAGKTAALSAMRQPSKPIPLDATRVHGITDADVAGCTIADSDVAAALDGVSLVIAHKAHFDRPMCEKLWPLFERLPWACSIEDVDWRAEGISSRALEFILYRLGHFHTAHRALGDATATLFALTRPLPSGKTGMQLLLESARRPLYEVRAYDTPRGTNGLVKARGYRWDDGGHGRPKAWWTMVAGDWRDEICWLGCNVYDGKPDGKVDWRVVPATRRYSGRV